MMKFNTLLLSALASATLAACGGGGDSGTTPVVQTANSFDAEAGTYSTGCMANSIGGSDIITLVITPVAAADKASVSVHAMRYNTAGCTTSVKTDFTVLGEITRLSQTKVITGTGVGSTKSGTAKTVEFKYSGLQLAMGNLAFTVPAPGATATVGFLIEADKFYALARSRTADGLPDSFSSTVMTKQ
jgi:hypothetical protein